MVTGRSSRETESGIGFLRGIIVFDVLLTGNGVLITVQKFPEGVCRVELRSKIPEQK